MFDPFFSVRETLEMQSGYFGLRGNGAWIDEILHHLDLTGKANANMRSLSGGMKRRVLVGQALVHKPPVIVLDEPTAGVDVELRQSLWGFIRKLNRDGHTIILTTHYLEEAEALCGRIAMLKAGRVVALDTTHNLLAQFAGLTVRLAAPRVPDRMAAADPAAGRGTLPYPPRHLRGARVAAGRAARRRASRSPSWRSAETDLEQVFLRIMKNPEAAAAAVGVHAWTRIIGHGWLTLLYKEVLRFRKVSLQTVAAPILSALLYLLIFSHVLEGRVSVFDGRVTYTAFLVPGLVMMAVLQNAFANSSSSLIQSKISGNLIFVLLTPLSAGDLFAAYVLGAMVRGLVVGLGVFAVTLWFDPALLAMPHPLWAHRLRAASAARSWASLGLIAGIWADKFDQLSAFQNFLIVPLTFLSGVFYSIHSLPPFWQALSHWNPFFYMIDGFRYGFFGVSDVSPWTSLATVVVFCVAAVGRGARAAPARLETASSEPSIKENCHGHTRIHQAIDRRRPRLPPRRGRRRRPALGSGDRLPGVRGPVAHQAAPAGLRGARRSHARGSPCAVDADADAGAVGRAPEWISC